MLSSHVPARRRQAGMSLVGYATTAAVVGTAVVAARMAFAPELEQLLASVMETLRAVVTG